MVSSIHGLEGFATATEDMIESSALIKRVDSKYIIPVGKLPFILDAFKKHYAVMTADTCYVVHYQNLYYDTPARRCYHDHRRGRFTRYKVRVRNYVERGLSFLELKTKTNQRITTKRRLEKTFLDSNLDSKSIDFIRESGVFVEDELVPGIWTDFERISLVGLTSIERVTIDLNLQVRNATGERKHQLGGAAILEVKQPKLFERSPAMLTLRSVGIRKRSVSKYCIGMMLIDKNLRGNRFLPTIKYIQGL